MSSADKGIQHLLLLLLELEMEGKPKREKNKVDDAVARSEEIAGTLLLVSAVKLDHFSLVFTLFLLPPGHRPDWVKIC